MDRRVKLVFADELGRFLLRKRGFSSCWFLVPPSARLVGDLAHEIRYEFGLSVARYPSGVDLVLEQLHLLPSHDIRIVRDNDEICVQCSATESNAYAPRQRSAEQALLEASSGDEGQQQEKPKKRRDKKEKKTTVVGNAATSAKGVKRAREKLKKQSREDKKRVAATARKPDTSEGSSSSSSSDSEEEEKKQPAVAAPKSKKRKAIAPSPPAPAESSSSSSDSSNDSSDSDCSSSSDSEGELASKARQPERKRQRVEVSKPSATSKLPLKPTPGKKATGNVNGVGEPRQRRRRRPRNRKPREERTKRPNENGAAATVILSAALPVPGHRPANPLAQLPPPAAAALPQPDAVPSVQETTDTETSSVVKGHVRFGDAGESQVVVKSTANKSNGGDMLNIKRPRAYVSPELKKYGPPETSTSRDQQQQQQQQQRSITSRAPTKQQKQQYANGQQRHQSAASSAQPLQDADALTAIKTKKKQWGDMWKRPYEIVATIHDQPDSQSAEARLSVDIPRLLTTFPPPKSDISATWFQIGDVVAYKTLALCMETWQPIASEWLCGKVLSASSSNSVSEMEVQPMTLSVRADGESEQLQWTPHTGDSVDSEASSVAVPIGEVSEIRYLEGPSFQIRLGQLPW